MIYTQYQADEVVTAPPSRIAETNGNPGIVVQNRSPWWLAFTQGASQVMLVPAWQEATFSADPTTALYSKPYNIASTGQPVSDFDVPNVLHGVFITTVKDKLPTKLTPLITQVVDTSSNPILLDSLYNAAVAALTNAFASDMVPSAAGNVNIAVTLAPASAEAICEVNYNGKNEELNQGTALLAGAAYVFSFPVNAQIPVNIQFSAAVTVQKLEVYFTNTQ